MTAKSRRKRNRKRRSSGDDAFKTLNYGIKATVGLTALGVVANTTSKVLSD